MWLRKNSRPQGFVIWMTGLPASGKSTIARLVEKTLRSEYDRYVEVLDGDEIRKGLSRDLGLSEKDRQEHALRVAYVAKLLARNGVVVIVALISPYRKSRAEAREMIGPDRFLEVYIKAPLSVCEQRDPKGLYAKARRGEIDNMTGIQHPYEEPEHPDIVIDTTLGDAEMSAKALIDELHRIGKL
ncbi:MAG: adenylyl-sulfate kinase [Nitrososphaerota archaeon]